MSFLDKIKGLVAKNADKVDTVIDKAGDLVDKKTQGKYTQHVDKVQGAAKKAVAVPPGRLPAATRSLRQRPRRPPRFPTPSS